MEPSLYTPEQVREMLKKHKKDYIPGGRSLQRNDKLVNIRPAFLQQCCIITGDDPQSGPIYCGDLAAVVADIEGTNLEICACKRHRQNFDELVKKHNTPTPVVPHVEDKWYE